MNEPFSMAMVGDHAHELVDLILGLIGGVKNRVLPLVTYRKPFRSVLALVAWMTSVSNHARGIAWLWLLAGLELRDTLAGDTAPADLLQTPRKPSTKIAKPQLSFEAWAATLAVGASAVKPTTEEEADDARNHARGDAENVAVEKMLDEWRASGKVKAAEVEDEDGEADPDDFLSKKPMKKFGSMHPLAPFVRPIQRLLLQLLLPLRAIRGLLDGRDDPVATSTVALLCLVVSAGMFVYAQFLHHWVTWAVGWFVCVLSYFISSGTRARWAWLWPALREDGTRKSNGARAAEIRARPQVRHRARVARAAELLPDPRVREEACVWAASGKTRGVVSQRQSGR